MYKYDPPKINKNSRVMYVLCTNDHACTCDNNKSCISQKIEKKELTHEGNMYVSKNFKTFEDEEDKEVVHFMIKSVDDLLPIIRENYQKHDEIAVAHTDDDLTELFYELKKIGYQPMIHFGAGNINTITCNFTINKKSFNVIRKNHKDLLNLKLKKPLWFQMLKH